MAFKDENEKIKATSKITEILKDCYGNDDKLNGRNLAIISLMVERNATSINFSLTSPQIKEALQKYPRSSVCFSLKTLERLGFVDRRTRNEGWFLSHSFLTRQEKLRSAWREILKLAGA